MLKRLWNTYSVSDEEIEQIHAETVAADMEWFEDTEGLLSQAKFLAPKLYMRYKNTAGTQRETVKKVVELYSGASGYLAATAEALVNGVRFYPLHMTG